MEDCNIIVVFLFGISIGSFLNVIIHRVPKEESIVFPASHCPKCNESLKWYHNIPLFSWIFLRGKCAFCKENKSFSATPNGMSLLMEFCGLYSI